MGYKLALDDLMPRPEMQPLIDIASYVKVDFRLQDGEKRRKIHKMVRGTQAALLAEKVEDQEQFNVARAEGYEYFQGYFFGKPTVTANREIAQPDNYLRLLVALTRDPLNLREVTEIVKSGGFRFAIVCCGWQIPALGPTRRSHQRYGRVYAGGRGPVPDAGLGGGLVRNGGEPDDGVDDSVPGAGALLRADGATHRGETLSSSCFACSPYSKPCWVSPWQRSCRHFLFAVSPRPR